MPKSKQFLFWEAVEELKSTENVPISKQLDLIFNYLFKIKKFLRKILILNIYVNLQYYYQIYIKLFFYYCILIIFFIQIFLNHFLNHHH